MAETRFGTFDELMAVTEPAMRPLARELRRLIQGIHPATVEVVRLGDRAATYGLGPKKTTEGYAYILPQRAWVNLGFFRGAGLPDPDGLLEGTGATMRHVKVRSADDVAAPAIAKLVRAALDERRTALGR